MANIVKMISYVADIAKYSNHVDLRAAILVRCAGQRDG